METIIVGAGIAGLLLAEKLSESGISSLILEKSRGVAAVGQLNSCAQLRDTIDIKTLDHGLVACASTVAHVGNPHAAVVGRADQWNALIAAARGDGRVDEWIG